MQRDGKAWWASLSDEDKAAYIARKERSRAVTRKAKAAARTGSLTRKRIEELIGKPYATAFEFAEVWGSTVKVQLNDNLTEYIKLAR